MTCNPLSSSPQKKSVQTTGTNTGSSRDVATASPTVKHEKASQIAKILRVIENLAQMAEASPDKSDADPSPDVRKRIYNEVDTIKDPDQLVIVGRICRSILAGQEAADVGYDKVFNVAFWHCVDLLSQDTSDASVDALKLLWVYSNTDGADTRLFKDAIAAQQARKARK